MFRVGSHFAVLVHDEHSEPVAGVEKFRRWIVVAGAVGVATHFLQFFDAEILQPIRQRRSDARMILMVAHALNFDSLAIEEKSLVRIEPNCANTERRLVM